MSTCTEDELRRALQPLRPDPEIFRDAVLRKLAERRPGARAWRRAAGFAPLGLLDAGLTRNALAAGMVTKIQSGGIAGALALPALALAMLALTFLAAARSVLASLRSQAAHSTDEQTENGAVRAWWRAHAGGAALAIGALAVLAWTQPIEAVVVVLLLSLAVVARLVRAMAQAGAATRAGVGAFTAAFLGGLLGAGLLLGELAPGFGRGLGARLDTGGPPGHWAPAVILWGVLVCDALGRWSPHWPAWKKLAWGVLPTASLALALAAVYAGTRPAQVARLARFVERAELPLEDVVGWQRLGQVGAWLREHGAAFDASRSAHVVAAEWTRRGGAAAALDDSLSIHVLAGAARLGVLPDGLWAAIAADPSTQVLAQGHAASLVPSHAQVRVLALARAGLDEDRRERLAGLLRASWPRAEAPRALEEMATAVELAEHLGRPFGDEVVEDVRRALELHWTGAVPGWPEPAPFTSDLPRAGDHRSGDPLHLPATRAAVALIARFGAPAGIDLPRVRRYLQRAASPSLVEAVSPAAFPMLTTQDHRYVAACALHDLDRLPGAASAGLAARLRAANVILGALLVVALCVLATWSARPPRAFAGHT
jgi:hypothetical protein